MWMNAMCIFYFVFSSCAICSLSCISRPFYFNCFHTFFLDAIASPSTHPCQWVIDSFRFRIGEWFMSCHAQSAIHGNLATISIAGFSLSLPCLPSSWSSLSFPWEPLSNCSTSHLWQDCHDQNHHLQQSQKLAAATWSNLRAPCGTN